MTRALIFVGGLLLGAMCAFVQAGRTDVLGVTVPWGVVLSLVSLVACVRAAAWLDRSRAGGLMLFLGWLVMTMLAAIGGPGGDVIITQGARQLTYMILGAMLGAAAAQLPLGLTEEPVVLGEEEA